MPAYTSIPALGHGAWDVVEVIPGGISRRHLAVTYDRSAQHKDGEDAARMLALALSLPGGVEAATTLLRAELARQS